MPGHKEATNRFWVETRTEEEEVQESLPGEVNLSDSEKKKESAADAVHEESRKSSGLGELQAKLNWTPLLVASSLY